MNSKKMLNRLNIQRCERRAWRAEHKISQRLGAKKAAKRNRNRRAKERKKAEVTP